MLWTDSYPCTAWSEYIFRKQGQEAHPNFVFHSVITLFEQARDSLGRKHWWRRWECKELYIFENIGIKFQGNYKSALYPYFSIDCINITMHIFGLVEWMNYHAVSLPAKAVHCGNWTWKKFHVECTISHGLSITFPFTKANLWSQLKWWSMNSDHLLFHWNMEFMRHIFRCRNIVNNPVLNGEPGHCTRRKNSPRAYARSRAQSSSRWR
jgi:hypothetical protein